MSSHELIRMKLVHVRGAMAQFAAVLPMLIEGESVRRAEWEPIVRMFVLHDHLMCQCGNANPWHHSLTWGEITALDWQLIQAEPNWHQTAITPTLTAYLPERPILKLPAKAKPLRAAFLRWWNSE